MSDLEVVNVPKADAAEVNLFTAKAGELKHIPLSRIKPSEVALRGVSRQKEDFKLLVDSIRTKGVLLPILVREQTDPETGTMFYGLIDGLQRFTAAGDAGLDTIPANVVNLDDAEVLEAQLITNLNRIETRAADQSSHLVRMLARNPHMTKSELAERVSQSLSWVEQRLGLQNLCDAAKTIVNENQMHLSNAFALSKLPPDAQAQHLDAAQTEEPKVFVPRMKLIAKEIKDAVRQGRDPNTKNQFVAVPHLKKPADLKKEMEDTQFGKALIERNNLAPSALEGWTLALQWVMNMDPDSISEQKRKWEVRQAEHAAERQRIKEQREAEKAREATQRSESLDRGW